MTKQRSFWMMLTSWQSRNRFRMQVAAFLAGVILPFVLFWSLNAQHTVLPVVVFSLIVVSMFLAAWTG
jgi:VIT1/CCC1 family predicted Fe2+/Mn2+ transporter